MAVSNVELRVDARQAVNALRGVNRASGQADSALKGLQKTVAGLASSFAIIQTARFVFAKTAEIESQTRSLQVLTGSVQQAKQIIQELQQLGAVTPFTSTELIDAAKRLQAFGVEGNRVVEVTRRLADASGATGAELQGIVTAYGQVVAKGRLQGEELLQFQERGIGLQQELQKMYNLSGEELQKALSKGRISAEAVEVALQRLTSTGGKYANGAIAQSDTLSGRLSTLQDGIDQLARRIGQVLTPALKAVFNQAIAVVDAINAALSAGRGGGFTRSVAGARQFLNIGATSQAVDNIAKGISQISSQQNRTGIDQNLQALQQYQRLLQSIGPDDPNASRAVQLQGAILQKINQNLDAQKQLNQQTQKGQDIFKTPALLGGGGGGGGRGAANKAAREAERTAEALKRSVERGDELYRQYSRQAALLGDMNEIDRKRLQISYDHQDRATEIAELKNAEQRVNLTALNDEIKRLQLLELQTEERKKQLDLFYQLAGFSGTPGLLGGGAGAFMLGITLDPGNEAQNKINELKTQLETLQNPINLAQSGAQGIADAFSSTFSGIISGAQSAQEALATFFQNVANSFLNMATEIIAKMIQMYVLKSLLGIFGGGGGGIFGAAGAPNYSGVFGAGSAGLPGFTPGLNLLPQRANGGSVSGGQPYLVGERGPELFMPGRSGGIAPTGSFGGGVNVVVNVDASGTSVQGDQSQGAALGRVVAAAVQAELIKQKRPGGLLTT
jgi:tape measure domain-containing protein